MSGIVDQLLNGVVKGALSEVLAKTGLRKTRRIRRRTKSNTSLAGGIVGSVLEAAIKAAVKPKPAKKTGEQKTHRRRPQQTAASMMHHLSVLPTFLVLAISGPLQGAAEVKSSKEIKIGFVVELDGADRISGTAFCKTGNTCRLVDQKSPKLIIDIKAGRFSSEIEIKCKDDCSLNSGHETMTFDNKQELNIYNGRSGPIIKSVFRRREPIGKIMLNFSYPPGTTRW